MAKHEFGILPQAPLPGERFDRYEPQRYSCIAVEDNDLLPLLDRLAAIRFYWHSTSVQGDGLAYCGITLLSPAMSEAMLPIVSDNPRLAPLRLLLESAARDRNYVIHFGI